MLRAYYTQKAVISLDHEFMVTYEKDGTDYRADFSVPIVFGLLPTSPLEKLKEMVEKQLGEQVELLPSQFEKDLQDHASDPKNFPSQPDCSCCHCPCHGVGLGMSCCD